MNHSMARGRAAGDLVSLVSHPAFLLLLVLFGATHPASAETAPRIRILDPVLRELFESGMTHSPTFRAVVDRVETSSILVFVDGDIRMPAMLGARLNFVTAVNGLRYVHVEIDYTLPPRRQIAMLAHELQHAVEIGDRPEIVDVEAMESLYEDIGFQSIDQRRRKNFETDAAIEVQEAVDGELAGRTSHGSAVVVY